VFTARYGLSPYIKQITFGLQNVNKPHWRGATNNGLLLQWQQKSSPLILLATSHVDIGKQWPDKERYVKKRLLHYITCDIKLLRHCFLATCSKPLNIQAVPLTMPLSRTNEQSRMWSNSWMALQRSDVCRRNEFPCICCIKQKI